MINHRSHLLYVLCHGLVGDVKEPTSLFETNRGFSLVIVVWPEQDRSNWLMLLRYPCQTKRMALFLSPHNIICLYSCPIQYTVQVLVGFGHATGGCCVSYFLGFVMSPVILRY